MVSCGEESRELISASVVDKFVETPQALASIMGWFLG